MPPNGVSNGPKSLRPTHSLRCALGDDVLVLPSAWDAASAAIVTDAGAEALANSSVAVAWANGQPDDHILPLANLLATIGMVAH